MENTPNTSLKDLKRNYDAVQRYRDHLSSQDVVWREAFEIQEIKRKMAALKEDINATFDTVIKYSGSSAASKIYKQKQEFNQLVDGFQLSTKTVFDC